jgi:1,4-alpha-glucan branching enzyme
MKMSRIVTCEPKGATAPLVELRQMRRTKADPQKPYHGVDTKTANGTAVVFTLEQPQARSVYLCGDFNYWSPRSLRMFRRGSSGPWVRRVALEPGRYQYKFMVDGEWIHDPEARENMPNVYGSLNSIIEVRACRQHNDSGQAPRSIQLRWRND